MRHSVRDVDVAERTGVCKVCGPVRIRVRDRGTRIEVVCIKRDQIRRRALSMSQKAFISPEKFHKLLVAQSGRCHLCEKPLRHLCVDHDHKTGAVRGLLCKGCNTGLGLFGDSPKLLRLAADYVEKTKRLAP